MNSPFPTPITLDQDPCPGCRPNVRCRTPKCGRLAQDELKRKGQRDLFTGDSHEALTFHELKDKS